MSFLNLGEDFLDVPDVFTALLWSHFVQPEVPDALNKFLAGWLEVLPNFKPAFQSFKVVLKLYPKTLNWTEVWILCRADCPLDILLTHYGEFYA